jgi:hypothetical protein
LIIDVRFSELPTALSTALLIFMAFDHRSSLRRLVNAVVVFAVVML